MGNQINVLVAVDSTEASTHAVSTAYEFFGASAHYTVAHIGLGPAPIIPPAPNGQLPAYMAPRVRLADARADAHDVALTAEDQLPDDVEVDIGVALGDVGPELARMALEQDADVIVLGSRDRRIWDRLFNPNTGRYLIENAPCPVLVIR